MNATREARVASVETLLAEAKRYHRGSGKLHRGINAVLIYDYYRKKIGAATENEQERDAAVGELGKIMGINS
jgi:hypothetical protein